MVLVKTMLRTTYRAEGRQFTRVVRTGLMSGLVLETLVKRRLKSMWWLACLKPVLLRMCLVGAVPVLLACTTPTRTQQVQKWQVTVQESSVMIRN